MFTVTEIASDVFRISGFEPAFGLQFNQFLIRDSEPLLFHTGMRRHFAQAREAVATLINPAELRWIGFSHFESDECGALGDWQAIAPAATPVCSLVGKLVNLDDTGAAPEARALEDDEVFSIGRHRLRFLRTPHVPHGWDAGMLYDEGEGVLFCSDLLTHRGEVEAVTSQDVVGRFAADAREDAGGPFAHAYPWDRQVERTLERLAGLAPRTLALMHGSTYQGDGGHALRDFAGVLREMNAGI